MKLSLLSPSRFSHWFLCLAVVMSASAPLHAIIEPTVNPPTDVTATAISSTSVRIAWKDPNGTNSYLVTRTQEGAAAATFRSSQTSYEDVVPVAGATYAYSVVVVVGGTGTPYEFRSSASPAVTVHLPTPSDMPPVGRPTVTTQPQSQTVALDRSVTLFAAAATTNPAYQWLHNGQPVAGATHATLTIDRAQPQDAGLYTATIADNGSPAVETAPAIVSVVTTDKISGAAVEVGTDIKHSNGNTYDQVILTGPSASVRADPGQVTRVSFEDLNDDIVQVEFSGAGALSLVLDGASGPEAPRNYNQPGVTYMRGHASLVITGADESTNVAVFTVGTKTAVNQALFRSGVTYDGVADIGYLAIASASGKFGGIFTGNTNYWTTRGVTGIYAPGVQFGGTVSLGDITAIDSATPVLVLGAASQVRVAGGNLVQTNQRAVQVSGVTELQFVAGGTSSGAELAAQANGAQFEQNGRDVTAQIATPQTP